MKKIILTCVFILIGCSINNQNDDLWMAFKDNASELIGFKDRDGNLKIEPKYTGLTIAKKFDKIIAVTEHVNGTYENFYLTKSGKIVGKDNLYIFDNSPDCENEGFIRFKDKATGNVGMFNENGEIQIPAEYNDMTKVVNGLVVALKGAKKKYNDEDTLKGCNHFQWVGGKEYLININNQILVENFKLNKSLNLFSLKTGDEPIKDLIWESFLGVDGKYYAFIDFKKEFQQWLKAHLLEPFSKEKLIDGSYKDIYFWKEPSGWIKKVNTDFIDRNYELIKTRLMALNNEKADYFITIGGLNPFIYESAEFDVYYNNCGDAKEWQYPTVDVIINHKTKNDSYQDLFEFLKTKNGYKLISVTIRNEELH